MKKLAMIAFGGNALLRAGEKGTYEQQLANVENTCEQLKPLVEQGYDIVIGHGNGPQVGNALLRHEAGKQVFGLEPMPMDFCGSETQGSIAYMIETGMERVLNRAGLKRAVVSLVTRVEVPADDPGFSNPTKPVGPYYQELPDAPAGLSASGKGPGSVPQGAACPGIARPNDTCVIGNSVYRQDPRGRGWRKVVASPKPVRINNIDLVEKLAREGYIVVTVGGGGIPVVKDGDGYKGVEAVIDKDLASALAAIHMKADEFYILTDVPKVYINFHTPEEQALDTMTVAEAEKYLAEGQFAEGSMAPKVRAGILFVKNGGAQCVITEAGQLGNPACGTRIIL
ncbi:MAG: carbamate kinase [Bacteroidales bacterium]|nr:carbamate kinase [Bacteroidales bacterium]